MRQVALKQKAATLTESEWKKLIELKVSTSSDQALEGKRSVTTRDLLNRDTLTDVLTDVQQTIEAENLLVAASLFSKRYAYLVAIPTLYAFAAWNVKLNPSLDNVVYSEKETEPYWLPTIYFKDESIQRISAGTRLDARDELLNELFAEQLVPVWEALHDVTKLPMATMWENAYGYVQWLYGQLLQGDENWLTFNENAEADGMYVLKASEKELFRAPRKNPFLSFTRATELAQQNEEKRIRQTCCFNYKCGSTPAYCGSCPRNPENL